MRVARVVRPDPSRPRRAQLDHKAPGHRAHGSEPYEHDDADALAASVTTIVDALGALADRVQKSTTSS